MSQESVKPEEHKCCVCLEPAEHEFNLVGFGCCTAKVCLTCKGKLAHCPQCRTQIFTEQDKCKICKAALSIMQPFRSLYTDDRYTSQIAVQIYDLLINITKASYKCIYLTDINLCCHNHIVMIVQRLQTLGVRSNIREFQTKNPELKVEMGYESCYDCGWFHLNEECPPWSALNKNGYESTLIDLDDGDDTHRYITRPLPEVQVGIRLRHE